MILKKTFDKMYDQYLIWQDESESIALQKHMNDLKIT